MQRRYQHPYELAARADTAGARWRLISPGPDPSSRPDMPRGAACGPAGSRSPNPGAAAWPRPNRSTGGSP